MVDSYNYKTSLEKDKVVDFKFIQATNPLAVKMSTALCLTDYTQEIDKPKNDDDTKEIVEVVRLLNNTAPLKMPVYIFDIEKVNGERFYKPDGNLLLVREYDSDVERDYYFNPKSKDSDVTVSRILEHDKKSGRLRVKIEPATKSSSGLKSNITIFDEKVNNKYVLLQVMNTGIVSSITEFSGKGKSFRALFRDKTSLKPVRYLEGKDNKDKDFEMIDCLFANSGEVANIKRYTNKKEVNINYTESKKIISVKTK